ncbi:MAG: hypothetical protein DCC67_19580 [Planctomycetota bacterium]|nr:MAG: hypothetical protein DCC67_19580 [Planctomycetota bacterium]
MSRRRSITRRVVLTAAISVFSAAARADSAGALLYVPSDIYNYNGGQSIPATPDREAAEEAFAAAKQAVAAGEVSRALQHACRAVAFDPHHAGARRLLGYQRVGDAWAGGYAQQMLKSGHQWRPEFGWIKTAATAKWDAGLRPFGGGWISAEEDARRRQKIERGWTVRTDHFLITTNIDRAAGVELAVRLETLYQLWRQLFGEWAVSASDLQSRLEGKEAAGFLRRPFQVVYHRNRQQYNDALATRQPRIAMTLGIYFDAQRESHFFAGPEQDPGTIAHETVHQFFYESTARPTKRLAATGNAWAVEGVACYFESLVDRSEAARRPGVRAFAIGAPDAGRLPAARHRRVVDGYYVPLAELSALGVTDLQARPDLARLYSQSAGLAAFFMDYRGGVYRKPFRELLAAVYAGSDSPDKLASLTGRAYAELDREYAEFMESLPVTAVIAP